MSSVEPFGPWVEAMERVGAVSPRDGRPSWNRLAEKAGVTTSALTRLASGKTRAKPDTIRRVAVALRLDPGVVSGWLDGARSVRDPYLPPPEADLLTDRQRKALTELIRSMAADEQEAGGEHDQRSAPKSQAGDHAGAERVRLTTLDGESVDPADHVLAARDADDDAEVEAQQEEP